MPSLIAICVPQFQRTRESFEHDPSFTAEILHQARGKSLVDTVKIDPSTLPTWEKLIGQDLSFEVRVYAMKGNDGTVQSGLTLADKKGLPFVTPVARPAAPPPALKAA
jgi:hypothetical protein